ncbi:hypothetical protein OAT16_05435 [Prolixibacteraceae bacterium]|nr:hypothetical protein [Prolixibacteraceae bacterium]
MNNEYHKTSYLPHLGLKFHYIQLYLYDKTISVRTHKLCSIERYRDGTGCHTGGNFFLFQRMMDNLLHQTDGLEQTEGSNKHVLGVPARRIIIEHIAMA